MCGDVRCQCGDQGHTQNNLDLRHIHVKINLLNNLISISAIHLETHVWFLAFDILSEQCVILTNGVGSPIYLECSTLTLFEEFTGNSLTSGDSYSATGTSSS
jgi:hypothetical protein